MKYGFRAIRAGLVLAVSVFGLTGCPVDKPPKPETSANLLIHDSRLIS